MPCGAALALRVDADGLVRVGIDEEAVPALDLRLEAAADLAGAEHHVLEVGDEARRRRRHGARGGVDADRAEVRLAGRASCFAVGSQARKPLPW